VRSSIRGRAGVLDAGSESGGALLLDDLHPAQRHTGHSRRAG